jgi:hypothetical protein
MDIQGKLTGLKFGDIVENHWASEHNPHRIGVFIRYKKEVILITDMKGDFWETYNDKSSKNVKIGNIFEGQQLTKPADEVLIEALRKIANAPLIKDTSIQAIATDALSSYKPTEG